jgi:alkylation response protein AidB-like acyl-CoA dehydrogenase
MAKMIAANITNDIIDLAGQCCGSYGISRDLSLANFYEAVRPFRILDGTDVVPTLHCSIRVRRCQNRGDRKSHLVDDDRRADALKNG